MRYVKYMPKVLYPPDAGLNANKNPELWYISGPMRGYHQHNYAAFDAARLQLLEEGYAVISPADNNRSRGITEENVDTFTSPGLVEECLTTDTIAIVMSEGVFFMKGWEKSVGAKYEWVVANHLGKKVRFAKDASPQDIVLVNDDEVSNLIWEHQ